jgi:phytoene synthase
MKFGRAGRLADRESADAWSCEQVARNHARTFYLASWMLPPDKRRATFALYAFCRRADDLVDRPSQGTSLSQVQRQLDNLGEDLERAIAGRGVDATFRELAWSITRFAIPSAPLHELLGGVAADLTRTRWERWEDVIAYSEGVAGSVGEMLAPVMRVRADAPSGREVVRRARDLGVAMQLTNILRDVGEDAARGRVYLAIEDLARYGFNASHVLDGTAFLRPMAWRALIAEQVARAREWYDRARPGIACLDPDAQCCVNACASGYSRILSVIERNDYDCLTRRASLGWGERVGILGRSLLGRSIRMPSLSPPRPTA